MEILLFHLERGFLLKIVLIAVTLWLAGAQIPWPITIVIGLLAFTWYSTLRITAVPVLRRQTIGPK